MKLCNTLSKYQLPIMQQILFSLIRHPLGSCYALLVNKTEKDFQSKLKTMSDVSHFPCDTGVDYTVLNTALFGRWKCICTQKCKRWFGPYTVHIGQIGKILLRAQFKPSLCTIDRIHCWSWISGIKSKEDFLATGRAAF